MRAPEQYRAVIGPGVGSTCCHECLVGRLLALVLDCHDVAEVGVHPVEDRCHGPEVGDEPLVGVVRPEPAAGGEEQPDVGPPEPVDRLFRIAHEEQPARRHGEFGPRPDGTGADARGDQHGQFDLDRVGVLEFVEQEMAIALVEHRPDLGVAT